MPCSLNFYQDQFTSEGHTKPSLAAANRMLYVRFGEVSINGKNYKPDDAIFCGDDLEIAGVAEWSQVWRWELDLPNQPPALMDGTGLLSQLRMSRVITTLEMPEGSNWLFRLDSITDPPGRIADRHQHPGPGIRCLLVGSFNVEQAAESMRDRVPGDPWWENGEDTVVAWAPLTMPATFIRGMILPADFEGKVSGQWLTKGKAKTGQWRSYVDQVVMV